MLFFAIKKLMFYKFLIPKEVKDEKKSRSKNKIRKG